MPPSLVLHVVYFFQDGKGVITITQPVNALSRMIDGNFTSNRSI